MWGGALVALLLLVFEARALTIAETIATNPLVNIKNGAFKVWFTGDANTGLCTITMQSNTGGCLSFGLGHSTRMYPIDSYTGWVSASGVVTLIDEWSPDYNQPRTDTSRGGATSFSAVSGQQVGSVTTIQFTRSLNTGDSQDISIAAGQSLYIVWATTSSDGSGSYYPQHSGSNRGATLVTFPITALTTTTKTTTTTSPFTGTTSTSTPFTGSTTTTTTTTTTTNGGGGFNSGSSSNFFSSWPFVMEPGIALCLIMAALLVLAAVLRQLAHGVGRLRRRDGMLYDNALPGVLEEGRRKGPKRVGLECTNWLRGVQAFRVPCSDVSLKDLFMACAYIGLNAGVFMAIQDRYNEYSKIQNTGFLACGNMVIMLLPAMRNGVVKWLLDWHFDQVIGLHHWLGRGTILVAAVHTGLSVWQWIEGGADVMSIMFETEKYRNGFIAMAAGIVILLTSFGVIRRCAWEFFMVTHLMYIVFFVFVYLHTPTHVFAYMMAVAAIYGVNKLIMTFWGLLPQRTISVQVLAGGVVRITLPKHALGELLGTYGVAQYALINFPGVSLFEWHPFSLASSPREEFSCIYVKGLGRFTKNLIKHSRKNSSLWVRIDGPYGHTSLGRYPVLVLVAGGIGVTPIISILKDIYDINVPAHRQRPLASGAARSDHDLMELQAMGPSRPLWKMLNDDETGEAFYFNSLTGEAQWERPENVHALVPVSAFRGNHHEYADRGSSRASNRAASALPAYKDVVGDGAAAGHVKDIYVVWTVQTEDQYAWFARELTEAQARSATLRYPNLHLRVFVTRPQNRSSPAASLTPDWITGRPDLPQKLSAVSQQHPKVPTMVFACGPPSMVQTVTDIVAQENCLGNKWSMHRENFQF